MTENDVSGAIVDAAIKVHRVLGPGLLESVYQMALTYELRQRGFTVNNEVPVAVIYEGLRHEDAFRLDLLVNDCIIVELKSIEHVSQVHKKQLLTYLRMTNLRLGLLINFGQPLLKDGLERIVNHLPDTGEN